MSSYRAARKLAPSDLMQVTGLLRKEALVDQRRDRLPQAIRPIGRGA